MLVARADDVQRRHSDSKQMANFLQRCRHQNVCDFPVWSYVDSISKDDQDSWLNVHLQKEMWGEGEMYESMQRFKFHIGHGLQTDR